MKRALYVIAILSITFVFSASGVAADARSDFEETYEQTAHMTHELFEEVSHASMSEKSIDDEAVLKTVEALIANANTLEGLAGELKHADSAAEARQMAAYLSRFKDLLQTEDEHHALVMMLSRYYHHFSNCLMMNPVSLKNILQHHVEELKETLDSEDIEVIEHVAEHQHLHADQMHYAAMIFGKKIWQKFSIQIKETADEIYAAAQKGDLAAVRAGIEQIEEPVNLLGQLVK